MRHTVALTILFLTSFETARAQKLDGWLAKRFLDADSVILISHEQTAGIVTIDDQGKRKPFPKLIVDNKPNYKIIKEQFTAKGAFLDTLLSIISRPFQDSILVRGNCYIPHHAILFFKNNRGSYIDICFGCKRYETSKDLRNVPAFDRRKWKELSEYFIRLGFKYELTDQSE